MTKRFYCDSSLEYRDYGIFDLSKSDKTKKDFWNEKEECYELCRFGNYLVDKTDSMLTGKEVVDYLNKLVNENQLLKQQLKEQDDVKWLRENTVWETMPTSRRTFSRTSLTEDKKDG